MNNVLPDVSKLSLDDKLALIDKIWDSIAQETPVFPIPEWLKAELDRRHEEYLRDPSHAMTWDEAEAQILRENALPHRPT